MEKSLYRCVCSGAKDDVRGHFVVNGKFAPPAPGSALPASSADIKVHYSFDMAQQVHFLSDPIQPGLIYFLTQRKCGIFGVACKAIPRQIFT